MKAILEFDLDDPDDQRAHLRCVHSLDMAVALFEILNNAHRNVRDIEHYQERIQEACSNLNLDEFIN